MLSTDTFGRKKRGHGERGDQARRGAEHRSPDSLRVPGFRRCGFRAKHSSPSFDAFNTLASAGLVFGTGGSTRGRYRLLRRSCHSGRSLALGIRGRRKQWRARDRGRLPCTARCRRARRAGESKGGCGSLRQAEQLVLSRDILRAILSYRLGRLPRKLHRRLGQNRRGSGCRCRASRRRRRLDHGRSEVTLPRDRALQARLQVERFPRRLLERTDQSCRLYRRRGRRESRSGRGRGGRSSEARNDRLTRRRDQSGAFGRWPAGDDSGRQRRHWRGRS